MKWFSASGGEPEDYSGGREVNDLATLYVFSHSPTSVRLLIPCVSVTEKSGVKSNIKPPPPPAFEVLDSRTFDSVALDPSKDVIVTFTAPWCGHCKRLKPTYEQVALDFKNEPSVSACAS